MIDVVATLIEEPVDVLLDAVRDLIFRLDTVNPAETTVVVRECEEMFGPSV